jgi:hypothetical protein
MSERKNRYYFNNEDLIYFVDDDSDNLQSHNIKLKRENLKTYNYFEASKDYEATHESLIKYRNDFKYCCSKFKDFLKTKKNQYEYDTKYNHNDATFRFYKYVQNRELKKIKLDPIFDYEMYYMEGCNNGALIKLFGYDEDSDIICDSYGYDYSAYYPNLLNSGLLYLPTTQGEKKLLSNLDFDKIQYGIYKINKLEFGSNSKIDKYFKTNKYGFYTHYDLIFLNKHNVKINMEVKGKGLEFNCVVWDESKLINTKEIFSKWFLILQEAKTKCKDNFIIKRCMSSLWGSLVEFNKIFIEEAETQDEKFNCSRISTNEETEYKLIDVKFYKDRKVYVCCKSKNPYSYEFARLKPFLLALSRLNMADIIVSNNLEKNLIRIHTDSIILSEPFDFKKAGYKYYPIPEAKTTGKIKWKNVNEYYHICPECGVEYKYSPKLKHKCD